MRKLALLFAPLLIGAAPPEGGFCERLAVSTGMKPVRGSPKAWQVNLLGGVGKALFGGSSVISVALDLPDELTVEERRRFQDECKVTGTGAVCAVRSPATLVLGLNGTQVRETARAGERAIVSVIKGRVRCEAAD